MQRAVAEILYIQSFGNYTSLENPNFEYDKVYGCVVSGFPIHKLGVSGVLVSRSKDHEVVIPVIVLNSYHVLIWFENITRSYWG